MFERVLNTFLEKAHINHKISFNKLSYVVRQYVNSIFLFHNFFITDMFYSN